MEVKRKQGRKEDKGRKDGQNSVSQNEEKRGEVDLQRKMQSERRNQDGKTKAGTKRREEGWKISENKEETKE